MTGETELLALPRVVKLFADGNFFEAELSPCPWCQRTDNLSMEGSRGGREAVRYHFITCDVQPSRAYRDSSLCRGARGPSKENPFEAIAAWNTRPANARIAELEATIAAMCASVRRNTPPYVEDIAAGAVRTSAIDSEDRFAPTSKGLPIMPDSEQPGSSDGLAGELAQMIADTKNEQDNIEYYSGGSQRNQSAERLLAKVLEHHEAILAALTTREAVVEECARFVEAQAKQSSDLHELINLQSELTVSEPTFSIAGLLSIAAAIRALADSGFMCEPMPAVTADGWCDWTHPLPGYLMQCCDCKLIHEAQFQIAKRIDDGALNPGENEDSVVIFRMRRKPVSTWKGDPGCP